MQPVRAQRWCFTTHRLSSVASTTAPNTSSRLPVSALASTMEGPTPQAVVAVVAAAVVADATIVDIAGVGHGIRLSTPTTQVIGIGAGDRGRDTHGAGRLVEVGASSHQWWIPSLPRQPICRCLIAKALKSMTQSSGPVRGVVSEDRPRGIPN